MALVCWIWIIVRAAELAGRQSQLRKPCIATWSHQGSFVTPDVSQNQLMPCHWARRTAAVGVLVGMARCARLLQLCMQPTPANVHHDAWLAHVRRPAPVIRYSDMPVSGVCACAPVNHGLGQHARRARRGGTQSALAGWTCLLHVCVCVGVSGCEGCQWGSKGALGRLPVPDEWPKQGRTALARVEGSRCHSGLSAGSVGSACTRQGAYSSCVAMQRRRAHAGNCSAAQHWRRVLSAVECKWGGPHCASDQHHNSAAASPSRATKHAPATSITHQQRGTATAERDWRGARDKVCTRKP